MKPQRAWGIETPWNNLIEYSIRRTRTRCIDDFVVWIGLDRWSQARSKGYRCVKVHISLADTTKED